MFGPSKYDAPKRGAQLQIQKRRVQEENLNNLQKDMKQEFHEKHFALWQNKGSKV